MKRIYLLRHAHAVFSEGNDFVRKLSDEGIKKCQDLAKIFEPLIEEIDLILCSSANRTKQTIEQILINLNVKKHIRPFWKLASVGQFEGNLERKAGVYNKVHQDLSAELTCKSPTEVDFQKKSIIYQDNLYSASSEEIYEIIKYQTDLTIKNILIVAHNPSISELGRYFSQHSDDIFLGFAPGGLACFEIAVDSWQDVESKYIKLAKYWP